MAVKVAGDASLNKAGVRSFGTHWFVLALFLAAGVVFLLAPVWAIRWVARPFPGFVVEQTLVIADSGGENWTGRSFGLGYPLRVISLNQREVDDTREFSQELSSQAVGETIQVVVVNLQGFKLSYSGISLMSFPLPDFLRLFVLPYLVGLAFLLLGAWVYRIRGNMLSSRAFAYFCVCTALACGLLFDLITTHNASMLWSLAISQQGGALISLALLFPTEVGMIRRYPGLRFIPYMVSAGLAIWSLWVLYDVSNPWAYVVAWRFSYFYIALGIVFFLGTMLLRQRWVTSNISRQQIRIILWGGFVAFVPIGIWLAGPLFGFLPPWNPAVFLPALLFFLVSIGVAILRYRLWEIDTLINRTLVFGALTLLLGGAYLITILVLQEAFIRLTGQKSPIAIAASTLVIALLFNPLRARTQLVIDRRFFRRKYDAAKAITAFGASIRQEVDLERLTQKLIAAAQEMLHPSTASLCSCHPGYPGKYFDIDPEDPVRQLFLTAREAIDIKQLALDSPGMRAFQSDNIRLVAPLVSQGELIGLLALGPRRGDEGYNDEDRHTLAMLASQAAPPLRIAQLVRQGQVKMQEKQRMEHELRVARFIQQTLLPKQMPALPGWQISGHYQPAQAVGGDFFDFIHHSDGRLGIVIGDATGKGIPAALMMAAARSTVRSVAPQLDSPGDVLRKANTLLLSAMPNSMFVTCAYAILDPVSGWISFANAGHSLPCLLAKQGVVELWATGMPLGLMPDMEYEELNLKIEPGERLLLFSDGLIEAHNGSSDMFGVRNLRATLEALPHQANLIMQILDAWEAFRGQAGEQEDDLTLVSLEHKVEGELIGGSNPK
jgi:serine phosphatase RsbU (regulator of sigma subunit)